MYSGMAPRIALWSRATGTRRSAIAVLGVGEASGVLAGRQVRPVDVEGLQEQEEGLVLAEPVEPAQGARNDVRDAAVRLLERDVRGAVVVDLEALIEPQPRPHVVVVHEGRRTVARLGEELGQGPVRVGEGPVARALLGRFRDAGRKPRPGR